MYALIVVASLLFTLSLASSPPSPFPESETSDCSTFYTANFTLLAIDSDNKTQFNLGLVIDNTSPDYGYLATTDTETTDNVTTILSTNFALTSSRLAATSSGVIVGLANAVLNNLMLGFWIKGSPYSPDSGHSDWAGSFCIEGIAHFLKRSTTLLSTTGAGYGYFSLCPFSNRTGSVVVFTASTAGTGYNFAGCKSITISVL